MKREDPMDRELRDVLRAEAVSGGCPAAEEWVRLLRGDLGAGEAESLRAHLERCPACAEVARDARRFLVALDDMPGAGRGETARPRIPWTPALAAAAAVILVASAVLLLTRFASQAAPDSMDPVAQFAATLEMPVPAGVGEEASGSDLVFRGAGALPEQATSLAAALAPYRGRRFAEACAALAGHGRRFPDDREARYLAGIACLKAGEADLAEALLASLAAAAGDRREDARGLLERLRRARGAP